MASNSYGWANGPMFMPAQVAKYLPRAYDTGSISPTVIAGATSGEQTFTVTGLNTDDHVTVNKPTAQAGLGIVGARVTAADTLGITFMNATATSILPTAAQTYKVIATKCSDG